MSRSPCGIFSISNLGSSAASRGSARPRTTPDCAGCLNSAGDGAINVGQQQDLRCGGGGADYPADQPARGCHGHADADRVIFAFVDRHRANERVRVAGDLAPDQLTQTGALAQPEQISQIFVLGFELVHPHQLGLVAIDLFAIPIVLTRQLADLLDRAADLLELAIDPERPSSTGSKTLVPTDSN